MCGEQLLPENGGVNDQDFMTMHRMKALNNIYRVVSHLRSLQGEAIHTLSDSERRILGALIDEGLI
jgi:hypothetical protein